MAMEFKHHYASIHAYMEQWVKTATKGKVTIDYALSVQRMRLTCSMCNMTLTCAEPTGTSIDYGVQEFVKIHAHAGGHVGATEPLTWPAAKAVTADFKPVNPVTGGFGFVPLPQSPFANVILKNIQMPAPEKLPSIEWGDQSGTYGPVPVESVKPVKKEKPLKIATGRKFR